MTSTRCVATLGHLSASLTDNRHDVLFGAVLGLAVDRRRCILSGVGASATA